MKDFARLIGLKVLKICVYVQTEYTLGQDYDIKALISSEK